MKKLKSENKMPRSIIIEGDDKPDIHVTPDAVQNMQAEKNCTLNFRPVVNGLTNNPGADMIRYARGRENMIWLGQGEGDAPTPDFIVNAAVKAMQDGLMFYGPALGSPYLRTALRDYYKRIYDADIGEHRLYVTQSGSTAMSIALSSLLDKGDEVVAVTPIWKNLLGAIELMQANTVEVKMDCSAEGKWTLDLDKLFDSCTDNTRVILLVSPSNPTGWMATKDEMRQILEFARARDIWIIADEVYNRLVYVGTRAPSFLDVSQPDDQILIVNSFSKTWAMTGWRLGWIVGPETAEEKIRDVALYNNLCPQPFTQRGAIAALEQGEDFIKSQIEQWRSNRAMVKERFDKMGNVHFTVPDSTFYAFFKVDGEPDCIALCKRIVDEAQVLLSPGCAFGKSAKGYVRMCFAVSPERLREALDRIEKIL